MVECYEFNLDDVDPVQDFLLKQDLLAIITDKPNKLYKDRKRVRHIKAVGLYANFHDLIDEKYHDETCPKPKLDVWIQEKKYYLMGTKIEREFKKNGIVLTVGVVDFNLESHIHWSGRRKTQIQKKKTIIRDER